MTNNHIDDNYISQRMMGHQRLRKDYNFTPHKGGDLLKDISNISAYLKSNGYNILEYISCKNIITIDNEGYKYKINLTNFKNGKVPHKLMRNPFAYENFILYLSKNHPNYMLIDDKYIGCKEKMRFICKKHIDKGIQLNTPDNIINNHHACKYCSYELMRDARMISEEAAIQLCLERNVEYIGRYTKNHETYIQYCCNKHNIDIQSMSLTHFKESKSPCRYCNISSGELQIQKYLISNNIKYETQKTFNDCVYNRKLKFDFYLVDFNTIIEYDGQQHFEPIRFSSKMDIDKSFELIKQRDNIKNEYCKNNNINLIRIPYWDYNKIECILASELSDAIFV